LAFHFATGHTMENREITENLETFHFDPQLRWYSPFLSGEVNNLNRGS
jgi:hypothetical protein